MSKNYMHIYNLATKMPNYRGEKEKNARMIAIPDVVTRL